MTILAPVLDEPVRLSVALGDRAYPILIGSGLLERAGTWIAPLLKGRTRVVAITDSNVGPLHLPRLVAGLTASGITVDAVTVPAGEGSKSWDGIASLVDRLLELRVDRGTLLLALGGGVIGDLVGFAASITMRGVDFVQIPTTLLAQVDSSVGGKTGINTKAGKNLVGTFYQPRLVLADLDCLATLPVRERRSGYAEIVKHCVISDATMFAWLEAGGGQAVIAGDKAALARAVKHSCETKAAIVAADEREGGQRALLNFGHTFGHALEAETGFSDRLYHGEAVAIGMVQAMDLSVSLGLCSDADRARLVAHLTACGLPVDQSACGGPFDPARLVAHMRLDKKAKAGELTFVVCTGLGSAAVRDGVPEASVLPILTVR